MKENTEITMINPASEKILGISEEEDANIGVLILIMDIKNIN